jgi:AraC-like DNA-binding protein
MRGPRVARNDRTGAPRQRGDRGYAQSEIHSSSRQLPPKTTGRSFTHHLLERRLENAAALLRDPRWRERRIADVAAEAGFTDLSHFSRAFRRRYGATPSDVRAAAMREAMRHD